MKTTELQQAHKNMAYFFEWFCQWEYVDIQDRFAIAESIESEKMVRPEILAYAEVILDDYEQELAEKSKKLDEELAIMSELAEKEKNPATSMKVRNAKQAETEMMRVALKFKTEFDAMKKEKLMSMESNVHELELDEVAALKNKLSE